MTDIFVLNKQTRERIDSLRDLMTDILYKKYKISFYNPSLPDIIFAETDSVEVLGYFDCKQNVIVLSNNFLDKSLEETCKGIFLHELAHWVVYRKFGSYVKDHGEEFTKVCSELGVPEDFSKARTQAVAFNEKKEKLVSKVEKLLALSSSPFEEESHSAIKKAEELMSRYSLEYLTKDPENQIFGVKTESMKRVDTWKATLHSIVAKMTGCFFLMEKQFSGTRLSFYGSREQVESAVYLHFYLMESLEDSYKKNKWRLNGITEKNSFLYGLCRSLYETLSQSENCTALTVSAERNKSIYRGITSARFSKHVTYSGNNNASYLGSRAASGIDLNGVKNAALRVKRLN